ncbi:hypothetical protein VTK73DRAFT_6118 [Phialemonium thermophilum]|uniref:Uncharacterized protein n=1 Tax=Phialemonium thermophilum TaxID=223376 RepID=A0ABR3V073_9PEZI
MPAAYPHQYVGAAQPMYYQQQPGPGSPPVVQQAQPHGQGVPGAQGFPQPYQQLPPFQQTQQQPQHPQLQQHPQHPQYQQHQQHPQPHPQVLPGQVRGYPGPVPNGFPPHAAPAGVQYYVPQPPAGFPPQNVPGPIRLPPQGPWKLEESHLSQPLLPANRHRTSSSASSPPQPYYGFDKETGLPSIRSARKQRVGRATAATSTTTTTTTTTPAGTRPGA